MLKILAKRPKTTFISKKNSRHPISIKIEDLKFAIIYNIEKIFTRDKSV